jgi:hypothetical protein
MNDDVKAAVAWLREVVHMAKRDGAVVPPHEENLLAHIDGEAARTADAAARAREEQRAACVRTLDPPYSCLCAARVVEVPLTATPLADELRALRERAEKAEAFVWVARELSSRLEKAEAERDEALAAMHVALRAKTETAAALDFAQSVAKQNHEHLMEAVRALRGVTGFGVPFDEQPSTQEADDRARAFLAKYPEGT